MHGLACWFDVLFDGSSVQRWLTTAPGAPTTHWYQIRCILSQPIYVMAGQEITGNLRLVSHSAQSYTIYLTLSAKMWGPGAEQGGILQTSTGKLELKELYYRVSQPQPYTWAQDEQQQPPSEARYHVACNERLTAIREENGEDVEEVPQEQQIVIFHALSPLNAKGRAYPGGNLPDDIESHATQRRRMLMSESATEELQARFVALTEEMQRFEARAMKLSQQSEMEHQRIEEERETHRQQIEEERETHRRQIAEEREVHLRRIENERRLDNEKRKEFELRLMQIVEERLSQSAPH